MAAESASRSVLFADISDSTVLNDALGDAGGRRLLVECLEIMRQVVEAAGGTAVERLGDELLCTFADPVVAAHAACELHRAMEAASLQLPAPARIRVGFHHGPVLLDGDEIFGDTVHVARRVASLAKAQQTLTTRETRQQIPPVEPLVLRFVDVTHLKGKAASFELFEVVWDVGAATATAEAGVTQRAAGIDGPTPTLVLESGDRRHRVGAMRPSLTLGRDAQVDFRFEHHAVSRLHARIEYRKRIFFLVDLSTNGSQRIDDDGSVRFVRRDECALDGTGRIVLGPEDSGTDVPSVRYRVESP